MKATYNRSASCAEACGLHYQAKGDREVVAPLCRMLVMAGFEDGRLEFTDERGVPCFVVPSILRAASRTCADPAEGRLGWKKWVPREVPPHWRAAA